MKQLLCIILMLGSLTSQAQQVTYNSTVDEIWGGRCWQELDGKYYATSESRNPGTWPANDKVVVVYGLHVPDGHVRCDAVFTPKNSSSVTLHLRVVHGATGNVICENEVVSTQTTATEQTIELMPDVVFPEDAWYRFELTSPKGRSTISSFNKLRFQRESSLNVTDAATFMAPSVHLFTWGSSHPEAPKGECYDWTYQEVMIPAEYMQPNTYAMSIGGNGYYSGIQCSVDGQGDYYRGFIFSVWDNGDTDVDVNLPAYLRSCILDSAPDAVTVRFGSEGTGASARITNGYHWQPGKWVQMLINTRPEEITTMVKDSNGQLQEKHFQNTLMTCWYKNIDDDGWKYLATIRSSCRNMQMDGFYSFVENWTGAGGEFMRRAYFRNSAMRSVASGKWYSRNYVSFSHTQGGPERDSRNDYGHGRTSLFENCFYMQTGGFTGIRDSSKVVPLVPTGQMEWVDTINIERLTARVDQAILKEQQEQMQSDITDCRTLDHTGWNIIDFSDEEAEGEKLTGRCAHAFDNNVDTYWHSQWKGTSVSYPHYVSFDAGEEVTFNAISIYQAREESYRVKSIRVFTSDDGTTWENAIRSINVPSANSVEVPLGKDITARYIKLVFATGYGTHMVLNKVNFLKDHDVAVVRQMAESIMAKANRFGGYREEDLASLRTLLAQDNVELDALLEELTLLGDNAEPLKYGVVGQLNNLASQRAYVLASKELATLCAENDGNVANIDENDVNVLDVNNNWLILRSEKYTEYYIYNLGQKKFLAFDGRTPILSDTPVAMPIKVASGGFRLGRDSSHTYILQDNYAMRPSQEFVDSLLDIAEKTVHIEDVLDKLCSEALNVMAMAICYDTDGNALGDKATQWGSNCNSTQNTTNSLAKMLDGDINTYYQSWYSGIQWPTAKPYIQLNLTEAVNEFCFEFTPSQDANNGQADIPGSITVLVSNNAKNWSHAATLFEGLSTDINETYASPVILLGDSYKYIRFQVNSTLGNRDSGKTFAFAEFHVYGAMLNQSESPYYQYERIKTAIDNLDDILQLSRLHITEGCATNNDIDTLQQAIDAARRALENPTSIETITPALSQKHDTGIYNLNGQQLTVPHRGIVIMNGKKLILK